MNPTRYSTVAKDLMQAIASGRYPVGSLLPTEFELCDLYDVSRHTVRAAINQLLNQGLVSRRKRVGTGWRPAARAVATRSHWPAWRTWRTWRKRSNGKFRTCATSSPT